MSVEDAAIQDKVDVGSVDEFDDASLDAPEAKAAPDEPEAKTEDKPEAKTEDKPEAKTEDEPDERPKRHMMPKERYDFQAGKRREAEARAAELETRNQELQSRMAAVEEQQKAAVDAVKTEHAEAVSDIEVKIAKLDEEAEDLRGDGDRKGAAAKVTAVRKLERQIAQMEAKVPEVPDAGKIRAEALGQMREEVALEKVIRSAEAAYPALAQDNAEHDSDLTDEVMDLYEGLLAKGTRPAVAMTRAVGYVVGPIDKPPADEVSEQRTKAARKRNLRAVKDQPPDLNDMGSNADTGGAAKPVDVMHMSIEEYEALGIDEDKFLS